MNKSVKLYHGSSQIVGNPVFGKGKPYNDYGLGFYCTKSKELASEWAVNENADGFVNSYSIDFEGLSVLNLNNCDHPMLAWLVVLLENRTFDSYSQVRARAKEFLKENFYVDYKKFDVIIGYRADDSYFQFAKDFLDGTIPYSTLCNAMLLGKLGNQYVLKSRKAFDKVRFDGYNEVKSAEWYNKKTARESAAKRAYKQSKLVELKDDDFFITDIIRGRLSDENKSSLRQRIPSCGPEEPWGYS